jgi:hypothetical protein
MNRYAFRLDLSSEEFLQYYRGTAKSVVVRAYNGQVVEFPASLLQHHILPEGIHGDFVLRCDDHYKCVSLERVAAT